MKAADSAVRAALNAVDGDHGVVRLGFAGGMAGPAVSTLTGEVRRRFPGIEVRISASLHTVGVLEQLSSDGLDIGFMAEQRQVPGISSRLVSEAALCAVVPLHHRAAGRKVVALASLAEDPFVLIEATAGLKLGDMAVEACLDAGFAPRVVQQAPDTYTMLALVSAGVGISVVPDAMAGAWSGAVVFVPLVDVDRRLRSVIAWREDAASGALLKVLDVAGELFPTPDSDK
nr:LysR family substrate-binding domain-containing protein [Arthrobacter sp. SDTb3-6]